MGFLKRAFKNKLNLDDKRHNSSSGSDSSGDEAPKCKKGQDGIPACGDCTTHVTPTTCIDSTGRIILTYSQEHEYTQPLKGWLLYGGSDRNNPFTLEFSYFSMHDLMTGFGQYHWDKIDQWLAEVCARGRHAVFRVVVDYPSTYPEHRAPDFLNVKTSAYDAYGDKGKAPDYTNQHFRRALNEFIRAMGQKYDGDKRIVSIQAGLLGYWGEWHMLKDFPDAELQHTVLSAFSEAFQTTYVQVSVDACERSNCHNLAKYRIGYHDDSYAGTTLRQAMPAMRKCNVDMSWQRLMNGGEMTYCNEGNQKEFFLTDQGTHKFEATIKELPVTWLLCDAFKTYAGAERLRAIHCAAKMGYQLHMSSILCARDGLTFVICNRGMVPFYYPVWVSATCEQLGPQTVGNTPYEHNEQLRYLLPNQSLEMVIPMPLAHLEGQTVTVSLKINSTMLYDTQVIHWANAEDTDGLLVVHPPVTPNAVAYNMPMPVPVQPTSHTDHTLASHVGARTANATDTQLTATTESETPLSAITPSALEVEFGTLGDGQSVTNLEGEVSRGEVDEWDQYIEFECTDDGFCGQFTFSVPEGSAVRQLQCNYRGLKYKAQPWTLDMLNVDTGDWVNVWKNDDVTSWQWSSNTVDVANGPYVSDGEARVRWSTTNNKDAAQLDYLALKTSQ